MVSPFLAITLYFKNFQWLIVNHALYLYFLILIRDIVKDLENCKGDWVTSYRTLPIVFGNRSTKIILTVLIFDLLAHFPASWQWSEADGLLLTTRVKYFWFL